MSGRPVDVLPGSMAGLDLSVAAGHRRVLPMKLETCLAGGRGDGADGGRRVVDSVAQPLAPLADAARLAARIDLARARGAKPSAAAKPGERRADRHRALGHHHSQDPPPSTQSGFQACICNCDYMLYSLRRAAEHRITSVLTIMWFMEPAAAARVTLQRASGARVRTIGLMNQPVDACVRPGAALGQHSVVRGGAGPRELVQRRPHRAEPLQGEWVQSGQGPQQPVLAKSFHCSGGLHPAAAAVQPISVLRHSMASVTSPVVRLSAQSAQGSRAAGSAQGFDGAFLHTLHRCHVEHLFPPGADIRPGPQGPSGESATAASQWQRQIPATWPQGLGGGGTAPNPLLSSALAAKHGAGSTAAAAGGNTAASPSAAQGTAGARSQPGNVTLTMGVRVLAEQILAVFCFARRRNPRL